MKKNYLFCAVLTSLILLTNCKDVVDADENIQKTLLTFNKILDDQTHNVIMPLKPGNKWIYKATSYNPNINYYDTIEVYDEVTINGNKWFNVKYPMVAGAEIIKMTNTDQGLWIKCDSCSYNYAPFPVLSSDVVVSIDTMKKFINSNMLLTEITHGYHISKSIPVTFKNTNTFGIQYNLKQNIRILQGDTTKKILPSSDYEMIFVPDSGLFKNTYYKIIDSVTKRISTTYELIDCNISR